MDTLEQLRLALAGRLDIERQIGQGGMATVYLARELKHGRHVALKVLLPELGVVLGKDRFLKEIQLTATLQHPHILPLFDSGEVDGLLYYTMPFVEGESLRARLTREHEISIDEAVRIAAQVAGALDYAHRRGVVHRDLKPENILLAEGQPVVADFGIALAISNAGGSRITQTGISLGTPQYMSPEQATGDRQVDARSDIFSLGAVLYEMLAGDPPHTGSTAQAIIAHLLTERPRPIRGNRPAVPLHIEQAVMVALEKLPADRFASAQEFCDALEDKSDRMRRHRVVVGASAAKPGRITRREAVIALAGGAVGIAAASAFAVRRYRSDGTARRLARFAMNLPAGYAFTPSFNRRIAISPDGNYLAALAVHGDGASLLVRSLRDLELKPPMEGARGVPFFSSDARTLGYYETSTPFRLRKLALSGGAPVTLCSIENFAGATWTERDTIYLVASVPGGIMSLPGTGGEPREALKVALDHGERLHKFPHALPGGKAVLYTLATADSESFDNAVIGVFSPDSGERKVLVEGGTHPQYSPSGHLVYARDGDLYAVRFDRDKLQVTGKPSMVLQGVLMSRNTGVANFDVSATGDLLYIPGKAEGGSRTLYWVDRRGVSEKLPLPPRSYLHPRISPDGRKLAIEIEGSSHDVFVYDFARGVLSNLTTDGLSHWPVWSPDGAWIGYRNGVMGRYQLFQVPADRSRPAQRITGLGDSQNFESYSPDGHEVVYTWQQKRGVPPKIAVAALTGDTKPQRLDETKFAEGSAKFSPNGHWLAYCSSESGKPQVYVQALPGPGAKIQVSSEGGTDPVWRRDGRELFYRNGDSMMGVAVSMTSGMSLGRPQELWKGAYSLGMSSSCGLPGLTSSNYDVSPDGEHFLMIKDDDRDSASTEMVFVQDWASELDRASATA
jgi:tRNA A-37 threonylcarbamoyl transferase component Bud32